MADTMRTFKVARRHLGCVVFGKLVDQKERGRTTPSSPAAAIALRVSRQPLSAVLHGHRESKPLVKRYLQWRRDQRFEQRMARELPAVARRIGDDAAFIARSTK